MMYIFITNIILIIIGIFIIIDGRRRNRKFLKELDKSNRDHFEFLENIKNNKDL